MYHHHQACIRHRRKYSTVRTGREAVPHKIATNILLPFYIFPAFTFRQAHPTKFPALCERQRLLVPFLLHSMNYQEMVFLIRKHWLGNPGPDSFPCLRHLFFGPHKALSFLRARLDGQRLGLGKERHGYGKPNEYSDDDSPGLSRKLISIDPFSPSWT